MGYSRRRGFSGQRTYEPISWADEQEELRLIGRQEAKRAAADLPNPQARH